MKSDPELSDREHGRRAGVSKNTAATVREDLEERGQIDHASTRTDTEGRSQPAKKPRKDKAEKPRQGTRVSSFR